MIYFNKQLRYTRSRLTCRNSLTLCVFCSLGPDDCCTTASPASGSKPRRSDGILKRNE